MFGGKGRGTAFFNDLHLLDLKKAPMNMHQLSAAVGRCRLPVSVPVLKARIFSAGH
jgi:hypothetical protein